MPSNPIISVIIPTYNRKELLRQAIESVQHQIFKDYEIIVATASKSGFRSVRIFGSRSNSFHDHVI